MKTNNIKDRNINNNKNINTNKIDAPLKTNINPVKKDNTNLYTLNKLYSNNNNKTDNNKNNKNNYTKKNNSHKNNLTLYNNTEGSLYTKYKNIKNIKNKQNKDSIWLIIPYAIILKTNIVHPIMRLIDKYFNLNNRYFGYL